MIFLSFYKNFYYIIYVKYVNYVTFVSKSDVMYVKYVSYVINVGKKQTKVNMKHPKDKDLEGF